MLAIKFDMYQTLAIAVVMLFVGVLLKRRISFLEKFCIPSPVVGGLLFALVSCILYTSNVIEFAFDETLKSICMVAFFTSVGFQANIKIIKSGGRSLAVFLMCVIALTVMQNVLAIGVAQALNVSAFVGLCTGSISMIGGHGTSGAFGPVLEDLGLNGATTLCTAAATFGLVMGSLMGGPLGRRLILKNDLLKTAIDADETPLVEEQ